MLGTYCKFPQVIMLKIFFWSSGCYIVFISGVGFSSRKTRHLAGLARTRGQITSGSVSSLGCLFCTRFKRTHNDKPLCSSPLSPSCLVGVSCSPLCSSCLTTYNYVVWATGMEPCWRKKPIEKEKAQKHWSSFTWFHLNSREEKLRAINLTHGGI